MGDFVTVMLSLNLAWPGPLGSGFLTSYAFCYSMPSIVLPLVFFSIGDNPLIHLKSFFLLLLLNSFLFTKSTWVSLVPYLFSDVHLRFYTFSGLSDSHSRGVYILN